MRTCSAQIPIGFEPVRTRVNHTKHHASLRPEGYCDGQIMSAGRQAAGTVFADASDEYGSVAAVLARLQAWQQHHPGAYRDAYMAVSAPAIFAPFVRLQLLAWNPLWGGASGERPIAAARPIHRAAP